jgi:hypothetical protein
MDPDEAMRMLVECIERGHDTEDPADALLTWLRSGGFMPHVGRDTLIVLLTGLAPRKAVKVKAKDMGVQVTGVMRVQGHTGEWVAYVYDGCSSPSTVHMASVSDVDAAVTRGDVDAPVAAEARRLFMAGNACRIIAGPVDA